MNSEDNKRRLLATIEDLKYEIISDISKTIDVSTEDKNYEAKKRLDAIKNNFIEIMQSESVSVNQEYLDSELEVLESQIKKTLNNSNEDLYDIILQRLNRYVSILSEEPDKDEQQAQKMNEKRKIEYQFEENKEKRKKDITYRVIPNIEEYLADAFSSTMRRMDSLGIIISAEQVDCLKSDISSKIKNKSVQDLGDFYMDQDSELFGKINSTLEQFFNEIEQMLDQNEQGDKTSPKESPFGHYEIDHELALKRAEGQSTAREKLEELFK